MFSIRTPFIKNLYREELVYFDFIVTRAENFRKVDISRSMLDLLFFFISRLNNACSPLVFNLQINQLIRIQVTGPF